ncbi:MAG: rhodanese-like domain-containing protein [Bacteroidales bacterium]|nr:rhodanese-like domain-containing protein [Bacteroidales bacterium]
MLINLVKEKSFYSRGMYNLIPSDALMLCNLGAILIDVREDYLNTHKRFDVPFCFQIPISDINNYLNDFNHTDVYIFADSVGLRSAEAIKILDKEGFNNVFNLAGGIVEWEKSCMPVITNPDEMLSGSCACQLKYRNLTKNKDNDK